MVCGKWDGLCQEEAGLIGISSPCMAQVWARAHELTAINKGTVLLVDFNFNFCSDAQADARKKKSDGNLETWSSNGICSYTCALHGMGPPFPTLDVIHDIIMCGSTVVAMKERIWSLDNRQEGQQSQASLFFIFFFFFFSPECTVRSRLSLMIENCFVARTLK